MRLYLNKREVPKVLEALEHGPKSPEVDAVIERIHKCEVLQKNRRRSKKQPT